MQGALIIRAKDPNSPALHDAASLSRVALVGRNIQLSKEHWLVPFDTRFEDPNAAAQNFIQRLGYEGYEPRVPSQAEVQQILYADTYDRFGQPRDPFGLREKQIRWY